MCGRMSLTIVERDLEARYWMDAHPEYSPRYNIAPQEDLDVITALDAEQIDRFNWGLRPHWVDDPEDWGPPINARAETVAEKSSFRAAFAERRCLVLADGFYEWKGERGHKQPYRIERTDDEPFAFAGLWESWGEDGDELKTVTIITTEPNEAMEPIHDRMPAMLEPDEEDQWLVEDHTDELQQFLDPYPGDLTDAYPISKRVNDPENDSPELIEPVDIGEQSGLEEFG